MKLTRRKFFYASVVALAGCAKAPERKPDAGAIQSTLPVIDFHAHLFGLGDGGTGCFVSPKQKRNVNFPFFLRLLRLKENGRFDEDYVQRIVGHLRSSSVNRAVLLAQDCRYDDAGKPDTEGTSFYVPNDYVWKVAGRFPDLFIPCISVNPKRRDAISELEKWADKGVRVLKIHPPIQCVDPGESRFRPFYRKCSERGVIVMVHTGTEHSAEICDPYYAAPRRLVTALEEGCTVVAAHSGMNAFFDKEDFFPELLPLVRRFPNLYCDTAVLGDRFRWRDLPRLIGTSDVLERTIYGSDTPFPCNPLVFWNRLRPGKLLALLSETNLFERNYQLQRAVGLPPEVFLRGARVLSHAGIRLEKI
jgi:predicted TIM-barrel fold metal-dependent hydrolase